MNATAQTSRTFLRTLRALRWMETPLKSERSTQRRAFSIDGPTYGLELHLPDQGLNCEKLVDFFGCSRL